MIVRNFLGGSTGGEQATIFVTGLTQTDSVYATSPSGKRIDGVWGIYAVEGASVSCFSIPCSEYGTYTLTASNGKTQEWLVDAAAEFVVDMSALPSGTTAYFKFNDMKDEVSGLTWARLTGAPTISNESPYSTGHSLYLNGSSSVTIPFDSKLDLTTNGTIEFWSKITSNASQGNNFIYGNPIRSGTFSKGFGLYVCSQNITANNKYTFAYGNGSSECQEKVGASTDIVDGQWHHWSLNRDGNVYKLYKDGNLYKEFTVPMVNGTTAFLIGKSRDTAYYWTGYITELIVVQNGVLRSGNFTPPSNPYIQ